MTFFPKWHSVKYNFDYTTMNQMHYQYVKARRNAIMVGTGCVAGSTLGYLTRNPLFD